MRGLNHSRTAAGNLVCYTAVFGVVQVSLSGCLCAFSQCYRIHDNTVNTVSYRWGLSFRNWYKGNSKN